MDLGLQSMITLNAAMLRVISAHLSQGRANFDFAEHIEKSTRCTVYFRPNVVKGSLEVDAVQPVILHDVPGP